jgi:hypothetical protein
VDIDNIEKREEVILLNYINQHRTSARVMVILSLSDLTLDEIEQKNKAKMQSIQYNASNNLNEFCLLSISKFQVD